MIWCYGYRELHCNVEIFNFHCIAAFEFLKKLNLCISTCLGKHNKRHISNIYNPRKSRKFNKRPGRLLDHLR